MIVIIGKTASGKDLIVKKLCNEYGYNKIVTYTTRPMRKGESDKVTYNFIPEEEFKQKIKDGFFAEYKSYQSEFGEWFYGTSRESILNSDDKSIIILTPEGYRDILFNYPNLKHKSIYLYANNNTIKGRLMKRGDDKTEAERRVKHDNEDFKGIESLAHKIVYNNFDYPIDDVLNKVLAAIGGK